MAERSKKDWGNLDAFTIQVMGKRVTEYLDGFDLAAFAEFAKEFLKGLPCTEREVFTALCGFEDGQRRSEEEVAAAFKMCVRDVRCLKEDAIASLRIPLRSLFQQLAPKEDISEDF